jgi:hypothetical protein
MTTEGYSAFQSWQCTILAGAGAQKGAQALPQTWCRVGANNGTAPA